MKTVICLLPMFLLGCETIATAPAAPAPQPVSSTSQPEAENVTADRPADESPGRPADAVGAGPRRTVASLGDPGKPGLWLETPLVQAERSGRATVVATGKTSAVTLIPIDGPATGGSRISLGAMQALGVSPADLVELSVISEG